MVTVKEARAETMPNKKDQWYWGPLEPDYYFLDKVLTYKTPCKPKPKDLFSLFVYIYLYMTS